MLMLTQSSPRLKLRQRLGQWLIPWNQMRCEWPFLYDATSDQLFRHTCQGYTQHEKLWRVYNKTPSQGIINPVISEWAVPVNVTEYNHTLRLQWGWQQSGAPRPSVQGHTATESFFDLLPTMNYWEWQLLFDVDLLCDERLLWDALTTQICTIVSDGSAVDGWWFEH